MPAGDVPASTDKKPVGFVRLKSESAREGRAVVFLVPVSQVLDAREIGLDVVGVSTLREAVRALAAKRR